jgi:hypothetical protein
MANIIIAFQKLRDSVGMASPSKSIPKSTEGSVSIDGVSLHSIRE